MTRAAHAERRCLTQPRGGFGALMLGVYDRQGMLRHVGNVGSGFDARTAFDTAVARLDRFETDLRTPLPALPAPVETDIAAFRSPVGEPDQNGNVRIDTRKLKTEAAIQSGAFEAEIAAQAQAA